MDVYKNISAFDRTEIQAETCLSLRFGKASVKHLRSLEIIRELEVNQAQAEETKLQHLILTIVASSASNEILSSPRKQVNNYMSYSLTEE